MIDSTTVLARMAAGDAPALASSYSYQSRFDDGAAVAHQVMQALLAGGQVVLAVPGGRGARWTLRHAVCGQGSG